MATALTQPMPDSDVDPNADVDANLEAVHCNNTQKAPGQRSRSSVSSASTRGAPTKGKGKEKKSNVDPGLGNDGEETNLPTGRRSRVGKATATMASSPPTSSVTRTSRSSKGRAVANDRENLQIEVVELPPTRGRRQRNSADAVKSEAVQLTEIKAESRLSAPAARGRRKRAMEPEEIEDSAVPVSGEEKSSRKGKKSAEGSSVEAERPLDSSDGVQMRQRGRSRKESAGSCREQPVSVSPAGLNDSTRSASVRSARSTVSVLSDLSTGSGTHSATAGVSTDGNSTAAKRGRRANPKSLEKETHASDGAQEEVGQRKRAGGKLSTKSVPAKRKTPSEEKCENEDMTARYGNNRLSLH